MKLQLSAPSIGRRVVAGSEITVPEDTEVILQGRARKAAGTDVVQADVLDVTVKVFDPSSETPATMLNELAFVVADAVYNTLQTDSSWAVDKTGYNVKVALDPAWLPAGGKRYRIELCIEIVAEGDLSPTTALSGTVFVRTKGTYGA